MLKIFDWFRSRPRANSTATELYGSIVTQARDPRFYTDYGVSDVAEMRYEMVVLHVILVLERLRSLRDAGGVENRTAGTELARELVEAFVRDMEASIREMPVGDPKVPDSVKKAAAGLHDRHVLYRDAFQAEPDKAGAAVLPPASGDLTLRALLAELFFNGGETTGAQALLAYVRASRTSLRDWSCEQGAVRPMFADPAAFLVE